MDVQRFLDFSASSSSRGFPSKVIDCHHKIISVPALTEKYRVFVITLAFVQRVHTEFLETFIGKLKRRLKTYHNDVRFLVLCHGSASLCSLPRSEEVVYWITSPNLIKQLGICISDGCYLLEVHRTSRWQLIYQFHLSQSPHYQQQWRQLQQLQQQDSMVTRRNTTGGDNEEMDWLITTLYWQRHELEQRIKATLQEAELMLSNHALFFSPSSPTPSSCKLSLLSSHEFTWGWYSLPLEIQYALLKAMTVPDLLACARAATDLHDVIGPWLLRSIQYHTKSLTQPLPLRCLQEHESQLTFLLFQTKSLVNSFSEKG